MQITSCDTNVISNHFSCYYFILAMGALSHVFFFFILHIHTMSRRVSCYHRHWRLLYFRCLHMVQNSCERKERETGGSWRQKDESGRIIYSASSFLCVTNNSIFYCLFSSVCHHEQRHSMITTPISWMHKQYEWQIMLWVLDSCSWMSCKWCYDGKKCFEKRTLQTSAQKTHFLSSQWNFSSVSHTDSN